MCITGLAWTDLDVVADVDADADVDGFFFGGVTGQMKTWMCRVVWWRMYMLMWMDGAGEVDEMKILCWMLIRYRCRCRC